MGPALPRPNTVALAQVLDTDRDRVHGYRRSTMLRSERRKTKAPETSSGCYGDAIVSRNTISGALDGPQIDGRRVLLCRRGSVVLTPRQEVR